MLQPNKDLENIFENAVTIAASNDHEYITLEHFLLSLISNDNFAELLKTFGANVNELKEDLQKYISEELNDIVNPEIEKPKKTNTVDRVLNRAFTHVLFSGRQIIEPADCFLSIFSEKKSHANYFLKKAKIEKDQFMTFLNKELIREESDDIAQKNPQLERIIVQFCSNLTARAKAKKIDPVIGREKEIEEIELVLARRVKANAIMIGDPGVGKTAIAEDLLAKL
jgi:ATP-dependent Clp protease ATP-binding subunit ClpA